MGSKRAIAVLAGGLLVGGTAAQAVQVEPPFDADYTLVSLSSPDGDAAAPIPDVPSPYAALAFGDLAGTKLVLTGASYHPEASLYGIAVSRDGSGHVDGFAARGQLIASAPGLPGVDGGAGNGLTLGNGARWLYASTIDGSLGIIGAGHTAPDRVVDLKTGAHPVATPGPLVLVPQDFARRGRLRLIDTLQGTLYELWPRADGSGAFDLAHHRVAGGFSGLVGPGPTSDSRRITGMAHVAAGNPGFPAASLLVANCDFNGGTGTGVFAFRLDGNGNPVLASQRTVVSDLCPSGMTVDPVTGDLLLTTHYGFPNLYALRGFTVAPPPALFRTTQFGADENAGFAIVRVVRQGDVAQSLTVRYATLAGTAVAGVNYRDRSGTLSWAAGDATARRFRVPLLPDGVHTGPLTVRLELTRDGDARTVAATLVVRDVDP